MPEIAALGLAGLRGGSSGLAWLLLAAWPALWPSWLVALLGLPCVNEPSVSLLATDLWLLRQSCNGEALLGLDNILASALVCSAVTALACTSVLLSLCVPVTTPGSEFARGRGCGDSSSSAECSARSSPTACSCSSRDLAALRRLAVFTTRSTISTTRCRTASPISTTWIVANMLTMFMVPPWRDNSASVASRKPNAQLLTVTINVSTRTGTNIGPNSRCILPGRSLKPRS
mmetsp:Transcript_104850/g.296695  ORF Transcript_104850/g.296695 Transcript_104850/m.296695 type:complete len:231 (-) Transcript_104850:398-1090(-)